jgi:hypothetical protein
MASRRDFHRASLEDRNISQNHQILLFSIHGLFQILVLYQYLFRTLHGQSQGLDLET